MLSSPDLCLDVFLACINHKGFYNHNGANEVFFIYEWPCLCDLDIEDLRQGRAVILV